MTSYAGDSSRVFICLDCRQDFVWHPGNSGLDWPSGCGLCDSLNIREFPSPEHLTDLINRLNKQANKDN